MRLFKAVQRWFEFPDDPDKGAVLIEHIEDPEMREIFDDTTESEVYYPAGSDEPRTIVRANMPRRRKAILARTVKNWRNMYDADGKAMEFSEENLLLFARKTEGFNEAVEAFRQKLRDDVIKARKAAEKN